MAIDKGKIPEELNHLFQKNNNDTKKKIIKGLGKLPSQQDGSGYLYGYESPNDMNLRTKFWIKIGITHRDPSKRIEDEQGGRMLFIFTTPLRKKLEKIVHLFFNYANKHRIGLDNKNQIEWFHFEEKINIEKYISIIKELVNDLFVENGLHTPENNNLNTIQCKKTINRAITRDNLRVNINMANIDELRALHGIGPALAKNIIAYRVLHGKFQKIDDIKKVKGVGLTIYGKIRQNLTLQ